MQTNKIDFVILWVDGKDKKWLEEKNKYSKEEIDISNSIIRYRDWDNLKYWFRSIEKYTPWVNSVYFITYGHLPSWLNTENKKLNIIKHEDFIPNKYLPTFNSNVIELNLFRIKELSENFVLFNDDFFVNDYLKPSFFFKKDLPCDIYINDIIMPNEGDLSENLYFNEKIINKYFSKRGFEKKNLVKVFNIKSGRYIFRNILLFPWSKYSTFKNLHLPQSFKKSTFKLLWEKETELLNATCLNKFRTCEDITQYIFRDWQLASGKFFCSTWNRGKYYNIDDNNKELLKSIRHRKDKLICMNDVYENINFEKVRYEINSAFEEVLPNKSSYEK